MTLLSSGGMSDETSASKNIPRFQKSPETERRVWWCRTPVLWLLSSWKYILHPRCKIMEIFPSKLRKSSQIWRYHWFSSLRLSCCPLLILKSKENMFIVYSIFLKYLWHNHFFFNISVNTEKLLSFRSQVKQFLFSTSFHFDALVVLV